MGDKEEEEVIRIDCKEQTVDGIGILSELLGFLLFMHHQIPQTIDQLQQCPPQTLVFHPEEPHASNPQQKRARTRHLRETLRHLKKLRKLTDSIRSLLSALRVAFQHLPSIPAVLFVLGSSPKRPLKAYEVHFLGLASSPVPANLNVSKNFSKQITRALISHDGGPLPAGPMKLFLFIKAPASSSMPQYFVPKRGYMLPTKKIIITDGGFDDIFCYQWLLL